MSQPDIVTPVLPPIFAGRLKELSILRDSIIKNNESVSVSGLYGIGKSSLILTMLKELEDSKNKVLPLHVSEREFIDHLKGDFLSVLVHKICTAIWSKLLNGSFSEILEETLLHPRSTKQESNHKKLIKRIFKIVTSENIFTKGGRTSSVGGKLIAEASVSDNDEISISRKPLLSFEFLLLLDELMDVLESYGYKKILICCDQLNHKAPKVNYEFISQYFDVLSSKNIIFMVSAIDSDKNPLFKGEDSNVISETEKMLKSFSRWVELSAFISSDDIKHLINNRIDEECINPFSLDDDCYKFLFELCGGYPNISSLLISELFRDVAVKNINNVSISLLENYVVKYEKIVTVYKNVYGWMPNTCSSRDFFDEKMINRFYKDIKSGRLGY